MNRLDMVRSQMLSLKQSGGGSVSIPYQKNQRIGERSNASLKFEWGINASVWDSDVPHQSYENPRSLRKASWQPLLVHLRDPLLSPQFSLWHSHCGQAPQPQSKHHSQW